MKAFVAAESKTIYIMNFEGYVGNGTDYSCRSQLPPPKKPYEQFNCGTKIVLHLIQSYLGKDTPLYLTTFSPLLNFSRKHMPTELYEATFFPTFSKTNPIKGETIAFETNGMVCMRWSDPPKKSEKVEYAFHDACQKHDRFQKEKQDWRCHFETCSGC